MLQTNFLLLLTYLYVSLCFSFTSWSTCHLDFVPWCSVCPPQGSCGRANSQSEHIMKAVVSGQRKQWMVLLHSTQWGDFIGLLPLRITPANDWEKLIHQAMRRLLYHIYWLWVWFAFCGTWVSQGSASEHANANLSLSENMGLKLRKAMREDARRKVLL